MRTMAAGKFKATCLAVMDEVQARREPVVITKNGKPVARLEPIALPEDEDPLAIFRYPGLKITGDVMAPIYTDEEWEDFFKESEAELALPGEQQSGDATGSPDASATGDRAASSDLPK